MLAKVIKLIHVKTQCQLADLLTKALGMNQFCSLLSKMGMVNIHSPSVHLEGEYQNHKQERSQLQIEERNEEDKISCKMKKKKTNDCSLVLCTKTTCSFFVCSLQVSFKSHVLDT